MTVKKQMSLKVYTDIQEKTIRNKRRRIGHAEIEGGRKGGYLEWNNQESPDVILISPKNVRE